MRNKLFAILLVGFLFSCGSSKMNKVDKDDRRDITRVMENQERAWSNNDLEGFMQGYWNSEKLRFYGNSGLTSGWQKVLDNYKIRYPNADHTGTLNFIIENISRISEDSYYVMGKYDLDRNAGDAQGAFMVIFKKIDGQWKIIADMSS